MKARSKFQQAILLFDHGYKTSFVASKLMVPYKEAQNFYNLYLKSKEVSEETLQCNTDFYVQSLEKDRRECIGQLLGELEVKKKDFESKVGLKTFDDHLQIVLEAFPNSLEILLFFPGISDPVEWTLLNVTSITKNECFAILDKMRNNRYN
ncbi:MAG: hypothetical protein Q7S73_02445 [bacterium]|nr:hypothetical protein [bacterium]